MSSTRHPQTYGSSEAMNRMLENFIRYYCEYKKQDWDLLLRAAEFDYNSAKSEDLGASPFEIDLGQKLGNPLDFIKATKPRVASVEEFKTQLKGGF